jgi:hypothetical protein
VRRVVFRSHRITRVKDLTGFRKTYTVPTTARSANRKFVIRIAAEDLKTDVHGVLESAQRLLGYRRKDVEVGIDGEGAAYLRTPDFEYVVSVSLDSSDPSQVEWHREIGQFRDADFLRSPEFETIFGKLFDQLVLEFSTPLALPDWVDRLEESTVKGLRLHYSSRDGEECRITLSGHSGQVIVTSSALSIQGSIGDTRGLLDQFLKLLTAAESAGESLALPISTIDRKN